MKNINKKSILIYGIAIILLIGLLVLFNSKQTKSTLTSVSDAKSMFETIYKNVELPELQTEEVSIENIDTVKAYTGLSSSEYIDKMIVSEPLMTSQAYSAVVLLTKDGADIEQMKQEIYDNIDMNKWICVSADNLYITNNGNVIFLVMANEDRAKLVYDEFKKYVDNEIGKELHKENSDEDIELPPEIILE